jgi:hypothetical protein
MRGLPGRAVVATRQIAEVRPRVVELVSSDLVHGRSSFRLPACTALAVRSFRLTVLIAEHAVKDGGGLSMSFTGSINVAVGCAWMAADD